MTPAFESESAEAAVYATAATLAAAAEGMTLLAAGFGAVAAVAAAAVNVYHTNRVVDDIERRRAHGLPVRLQHLLGIKSPAEYRTAWDVCPWAEGRPKGWPLKK